MSDFPLALTPAIDVARSIVLSRYADPRAAWLGGSVVRGNATANSDLDITVLIDGSPAPMRDSFVTQGIPVEMFVHTEDSLRAFCDKDIARRQPSMLRLVAETVVLIDRDGSGERLRASYGKELTDGPMPPTPGEVDRLRYGLTDLLDDFAGLPDTGLLDSYFPVHLFDRSMQLLLVHDNAWTGSGKGLIAAVEAWSDALPPSEPGREHWSQLATRWDAAINAHDRAAIRRLVLDVLERAGGPLWEGYRVGGRPQE